MCKHGSNFIFASSRKQNKKPPEYKRVREGEVLTQWKGRKSKLILLCHTRLALQRGRERNKQVCCTASHSPAPPPLSGRGPAPEGLLKAASCLLHSQRETKPVSCTPLLFLLHLLILIHPLLCRFAVGAKEESR